MVRGRLVWVALLSAALLSFALQERRVSDVVVTPDAAVWRDFNERRAGSSLKTLTTAEADFRGCDGNADRVGDFWTTDIRELYTPVDRP